MSPEPIVSFHGVYSGPSDTDPLTDDELALLLAIPRAAESTPNSTLFRLPLGPKPSMGFVDATCAEVRSIVSRLAETWKSRLSDLLPKPDDPVCGWSVGPGTTICIMVEPSFHGIFHLLAFWAIGCTVQFVSVSDPSLAIGQLNQCDCKIMLCSGFDKEWMESRKKEFKGAIVELPEEEQAHRLAQTEKHGHAGAPPAWPIPQRPTPALILQSSGTTGDPKILRLSLYYYTIGLGYNCQGYLGLARLDRTPKSPYTHPRLIPIPFYWSSFFLSFLVHLKTATPVAFAHFTNFLQFKPSIFIDWATTLDVGAITCSSGLVRLIPVANLEAHAEFFQSLFSFAFTGSSLDRASSSVFERLGIFITNIYGSSEFGRILNSSKAPYTHLRPWGDTPAPLVRPISDYDSEGSRYVELWIACKTSLRLAHHLAHGGVPVKLEPFPGDGPHKGEPAINLEDIFQELTINSESASGPETVYIHVGRHSDQLRLSGSGYGNIDAALYEATFTSDISARMSRRGGCPWTIDAVQLFGNNMPCTALVIQLDLDYAGLAGPCGTNSSQAPPIDELYESVEETNRIIGLTRSQRVHTGKRMLLISSTGTFLHGEGAERFSGSCPSLSMTHKRTPKRWENVCKFKSWLDGLDFNEP
ncbi:unnamed protein product [Rhizoctonia solani]|uniref:AMP-dependent synthetase/ligase domain-containing protein n=1 Tax=Rhizoctonia solani TaxID=456999 RepID=A0A8H3BFD4_9AGAM|nr:unnamed protein product [Rhizoctonia solani]